MQVIPPSTTEFATALDACIAQSGTSPKTLAVGVSGGPDSMALVLLAKAYAKTHGLELLALIVDHRLRPESASEAGHVVQWLNSHSIPHRILVWQHEAGLRGNLQDAARQARYKLMTDTCHEHSIPALLIGHHQDDQAETLLHHLARGSGVDGLSAMPIARLENNIWLLRPLLGFSKAQLMALCNEHQQPWVNDPSNENPRFARSLLRSMLAQFADQGLRASRLADTATHMARAQEALDYYTAHAQAECIQHFSGGATKLALGPWAPLPEEIRLRVLRDIIMAWQPHASRPRLLSLQALQARLLTEPNGRHTLGPLLWQWRAGLVQCHLVHKHLPEVAANPADTLAAWKKLGWNITLPESIDGLTLAPLGEAGWEFLCAKDRPNMRIARKLAPAAAWQAMPVLWESAYGYLAKPHSLPHIYPAGEPLPTGSPTMGACSRFVAAWQPPV